MSACRQSLLLLGIVVAWLAAGSLWAQKPVPLGQPNPQAPVITMPAPLGMQRGTSLELTLTGANLADPVALEIGFPAKVEFPTDNNNGKDNAKLRVRLETPNDAPIGTHSLRLITTRGISNVRLFCIDDLPQVLETDSNRKKDSPQALTLPCVVAGRADAETSDYYRITVKAGQRLSFEVLGRRLGSAFDPLLRLFDAKTGREIPGAESDDAPSCQTDARFAHTFKEAGEYLLELRDSKYAGGPDFFYRLRIGDFPFATACLPMAAKRGSKVTVNFAGPLVDGVAPVEVTVPAEATADTVWVAPKGASGLHGWPVALLVSDLDQALEQEGNSEPTKAQKLAVPSGVTGRLLRKLEKDHYVFSAKKGQRLIIDAQTLELYSPTLVYMSLRDAKGAEVAKTNAALPPPGDQRLDFNPPADGDFTLVVEHLNGWGSSEETYHLTITPYEPGFDVTLGLDRFDVSPGGAALIVVQTLTRRDYAGPIELSVIGAPDLTGQTILQGPPPPQGQPAGLLIVSAKADAAVGARSFLVQAKATINGKEIVSYASVRNAIGAGLAALPFPPRDLNSKLSMAVTAKPPFTLTVKLETPEAARGVAANLVITAERQEGFEDDIALAPVGLPPTVASALKSIPKGQKEVKAPLTPAVNAPLGPVIFAVTGRSKFEKRDVAFTTPVTVEVKLPFELAITPTPFKIEPGGKEKLKVTAKRKGGYQGPIAVELRNLPANVTAGKAMIAQGQDEVEIEIVAAANAAAGDKADVNVLGTATGAGNQQNPSPNFTVSVQKAEKKDDK